MEAPDLRTAFDLLDRDQDGHVTPEELQFMLRNLGIHVRDELIDDLLREASRTGNNNISESHLSRPADDVCFGEHVEFIVVEGQQTPTFDRYVN
uniref:EF-hand domain-containing protein n=1 Tax=Anopheles minimus TaxID=112268 RepID=A0A182WAN5_9DIPT